MKKITFLLMTAFLLAACSVDPVENEADFTGVDAKTKAPMTVQTEAFVVPENICAGEPAEFKINAPLDTNLQVQQWNEEIQNWEQVFQISKSTSNPQKFNLEFSTAGDYDLRYKVGNGGFSETTISVIDCTVCSNSLTAVLTCGETNQLHLSFTAEKGGWIVIQGGLNNKTEVINKSSNLLTENATHPAIINSKANVTRWEGNIEACQEVTVNIEFSGTGSVDSWTAKRVENEEDIILGETEPRACN